MKTNQLSKSGAQMPGMCNVSRGPTDCLYGLQTRSFFRDPSAALTASINSHLPGGLPHKLRKLSRIEQECVHTISLLPLRPANPAEYWPKLPDCYGCFP